MIVQSTAARFSAAEIARSLTPRQTNRQIPIASQADIADRVSISSAAREALAASQASSSSSSVVETQDPSVEARLAEIRARGPVNRSQEDTDYLLANDKRLAEILGQGKRDYQLTADEMDYVQKAVGFVNTFANLSSEEKALYDKAVASGNQDAAAGIAQIALIRTGGDIAGGANGTTYNPLSTKITAANIEKFFSHSIIDPSGDSASKFQALAQFLENNHSA